MVKRESGILLPVSSLPSRYGIGCFSKSAYDFVDWLRDAGQSYWQILPLGPTGFGDSPYQSSFSFAGNPYFISLEKLCEEGLLREEECNGADFGSEPQRINYQKMYENRYPLLRKAYERSKEKETRERASFEEKNKTWLEDYALFMAIKQKRGQRPLAEWEEALRNRECDTLEKCGQELRDEIGFQRFMQYHFFTQWYALKKYANEQGIRIIGDVPIYVAEDSADVWLNPRLFQLDERGIPTAVAGCPPDEFSPKGQLWGNPLYRWEEHKKTGYEWWISRLSYAFSMYDVVRIDHFRGFDSYYSIPYGAKDATEGHWEEGPKMELFAALKKVLGKKDAIAEDLGYMTDSVRALVRESGFCGMKVLQFGFDPKDKEFENEYLPHLYSENSVAYTGTHDNPTLLSWLMSMSEEEGDMLREYLKDMYTPRKTFSQSLIALLMRSPSRICMIPIQDYMELDDSARINRPSSLGENWTWRLTRQDLTEGLKEKIYRLTAIGTRLRK